jgi:hypothetical protein
MTMLPLRIALAIAAPLLLLGCLLTPGKFTSTLSINADRSFAFTYKGEVYAKDTDGMSNALGKAAENDDDDADDAQQAAFILTAAEKDKGDDARTAAEKKAAADTKNRALAAALAKESGYRSVQYVGDGRFLIDYAISGTLDHAFIYPFNTDAEVVFPFIALELRGRDVIRVKAPAFANDSSSAGMAGMDSGASKLDGTFTLDTDAEIVSQNNEDGARTVAGRKTIVWHATPLTKDAPTASLRVAPLK